MTRVKPKLYLNMSPETVEEGGLVFARNMKIDDDGHLTSDYGYKDLNLSELSNKTIVGHIVGLDNKVYIFTKSGGSPYTYNIFEYDEITRTIIDTGVTEWNWSGGKISGYVSTNISGEKILTIAEHFTKLEIGNALIPLKHINLSHYSVNDESLYTQAPICPTANLVLKDTYVKTIPNGVYVFFIRYKIRKDVYTDWFLCSRPIFGGTSEKITTLQGGLSYINLHKDSAKSFVLQLNFASDENISSYSEFQLGFIITHDEATDARVWKHFNITSFTTSTPSSSQNLVYFDYEDVKETNIDDLLKTTYELYNVCNVTSFKNKLYISNYIESNFNPDIVNTLKNYITLQVAHTKAQGSSDVDYKTMSFNSIPLHYDYSKGYYDQTTGGNTIKSLLPSTYAANNNPFNYDVTKLSKIETKEKTDVVRFDVFWNGATDPDIALIHNIYNDLYNKVIFGSDYQTPVPNNYGDNTKLATVGLKLYDSATNAYIYGPVEKNPNLDQYGLINHPWYNFGLSFGFGSYKDNEIGTGAYSKGCSVFNAFNYFYRSDYISGRTPEFGVNTGWFTRDSGFGDYAKSTIEGTLQREIEGRSFFAKAYFEISSGANTYLLNYIEAMDLDNYAGSTMSFDFINSYNEPAHDYQTNPWKYYNDDHLELINPSLFSTSALSPVLENDIKRWVYDIIYNNIIGIDENGSPILNINGNIIRANSISIKFKKVDFSVDNEDIDTSDGKYVKRFKISMKTTDYTSLCTFSIKNSYIHIIDNGVGAEQRSTLMPLSTYQPYVHFVDSHNIITNGVKLNSFTTGIANSNDDVLYLKYTVNNNIPSNNFKSFFISLVSIGDIVMEGFGYAKVPNSTTNIVHCIEVDTLLYNINDNITVKLYDSSGNLYKTFTDARYYSSGSSYPPLAFGNCGFIAFEDSEDLSDYKIYIIISRNKLAENINDLPKASSYIPLVSTGSTLKELPDGYYGSWLSFVKKPSFELSSSCYVAGRDVYAVNRTTALALSEFKNFIQVQDSITYFVRSNFNLNYLSLTEDITDSIFSVGSASSGVKQVARAINSSILSFIYELKSMYKDFSNKFFRRYNSDYKIDFGNTVRVSNVLSDETFNNSVFKFEATNYYNVPTDRGIIVYLFSIGNNIFVHTKGSLYKFDANQTIMASDSDITLQEAEPFDAGISQILDSQYGYGGIDNKEAGCITFDSYFFYDRFSTHIFAYGGNSQIQIIDASIYKLLKYYSPTYCSTLHDDVNHRVLFNFKTLNNNNLKNLFTISYNYKSKSFVSIHDIDLTYSFAGRTRDFSYKGGSLIELFNTDTPISNVIIPGSEGLNTYNIYGAASIVSDLFIHNLQTSPFNVAVVMFPANSLRETISSMKFIGETIIRFINTIEDESEENPIPTYDLIHIPKHNNVNPVKSLQIVTDTCVSNIINSTVDDTVRPDHTITDYKGFKHEIDSWNANYFRSIINSANIYNYDKDARELQPITPDLVSDNNSLVYGKYYVLVFNFIKNVPIKFEELFINSEKY